MSWVDMSAECLDSLLNLVLAYWMFESLWAKKEQKAKSVLMMIGAVGLYLTLLTVFADATAWKFFYLILLFALTLFFDTNTWQRILFDAIFFAITCTAEIMIELADSYFFTAEYTVPWYILHSFQVVLISKLLVFASVAGIRIKQKSSFSKAAKKYYFTVPIFLFVSIVILVLQFYIFPDFPLAMQSLLIVVLICFTVLIVANILMFAFIDLWQQNQISENKLAAADEIIDKQIDRYRALAEHHQDIIKMRHDHQNFCIGVLHELENGNTQAVVTKLKNECALLQNNKNQSGNIIHSVVEIKSEAAKKNGVRIDFESRELEHLAISSIDLAVMLGNALDNAIEATAVLGNTAKKTVRVLVALKNNTIVISIKNPIGHKIDVSRLTTQKDDPVRHGFGIISMRQLAAKYGGEVVFNCTENTFTTSIVLNNFLCDR